MVDPSRDKLQEFYGITAEYHDIDASIGELPDGSSADFGCEIYKADTGTYYAVISSREDLPDDSIIIECLDSYEHPNEYDIYAEYTPLEPSKQLAGFRVYELSPKVKNGEPQPISMIYNLA
jgi:hypothetical protein